MPYTTLNYANGPGVNFTSGKRPNLTNVDTSESDIFEVVRFESDI